MDGQTNSRLLETVRGLAALSDPGFLTWHISDGSVGRVGAQVIRREGGLPTHRLIEFELGSRFTPFRIMDGGLIPIEGQYHRLGGDGLGEAGD